MKRYIFVFLLFLFLVISGCGKAKAKNKINTKKKTTEEKVGLAKSMIAPDFTLKDIEGNSHTLSEYRGKVVLVDFWATWCFPCIIEIPHFVKLYNQYKERGFVILGASLDNNEKRLKNFIKNQAINYPVLVNARKVSVIYAVQGIPTAYLIDKDGRITEKFVGYAPGAEKKIEKLILKLIEKEDG